MQHFKSIAQLGRIQLARTVKVQLTEYDMIRMITLKLAAYLFDDRYQKPRYIAFKFQTHFLHIGVVDCAHDVCMTLAIDVWNRESEGIHAEPEASRRCLNGLRVARNTSSRFLHGIAYVTVRVVTLMSESTVELLE